MLQNGHKLSSAFYLRDDVLQVSRDLIGKVLCTRIDGVTTSAMITETEAYCGRNDKACHANDGLRTARTEIMYAAGGHAYIYLCYGIHHLFNVVTNQKDLADAVLIRAVEPLEEVETMMARRNYHKTDRRLSGGPGMLTQALGIKTVHSGLSLLEDKIWIEDRDIQINDSDITASSRIGVDYAGEHAKRPWRFFLNTSDWVSRKQDRR